MPLISSTCSGFMMAEVIPAPAAMARKVAFMPWRFGRPKLMFEAPQVELTFNSSFRRRRMAKA